MSYHIVPLLQRDVAKLQKLYNCANTSTFYVDATTSAAPIISAATAECADNDQQYCQIWADVGECDSNPTWMNINCRKACRQCGEYLLIILVHTRLSILPHYAWRTISLYFTDII